MLVCRLCLGEERENLISIENNKDIVEQIKQYISIEVIQ